MPELDFFDVNVSLGRVRIPKFHVVTDASQMKAELAPFGVTGGLVRHTVSSEGYPSVGNSRLAEELDGVTRFEPVWAVLPHWTGEFPTGEELEGVLSSAGVRAAALYPSQHGFPLRGEIIGPLLDVLEARQMILMLPHAEVPLEAAARIAKSHPRMPIVVLEVGYTAARELYAVFAMCTNVHIEISSYMAHRGIEDIVNKFGAERLLFGSRFPAYNPGSAVAAVTYARISDTDKKAIAAGNVRRLLSEVKK